MRRKRNRGFENDNGTNSIAKKSRTGGNDTENNDNNDVQGQSNNNNNASTTTTELLKLALERVCALQAELLEDEEGHNERVDAETAGFAACAIETFRFLIAEGLSPDDPIVNRLSRHLLGRDAPEL